MGPSCHLCFCCRYVHDVDERRYDDQNPELPAHSIALASEMRQLGNAMMGRTLDETRAAEITRLLADLAAEISELPELSKIENLGRRNRINTFIETGQWPPPPPDGAQLEFDPTSLVGGELNPFGMGARYYRDGSEVVGKVNLSRCFEGPPERVHGGVLCAIFDEVLGSVFRANGTASAFTGELTVRFEGPAPLGTDVEFRGRQVAQDGRKRLMSGEASGPAGQFASATAVFIEMKPEHFT